MNKQDPLFLEKSCEMLNILKFNKIMANDCRILKKRRSIHFSTILLQLQLTNLMFDK